MCERGLKMKGKEFIRKTGGSHTPPLKENKYINEDGSELKYLTFPVFDKFKFISHAMTTREGGVSTGCFESMNLSFTRGDDVPSVNENYERICKALGIEKSRIVCVDQKHTSTVRVVKEEDAGKGVTRQLDYREVDGHITNVKGLALAIFFSDCIPVFFVDPVNKAIGLAHSGWRGTVGRIGKVMVEKMTEEYGSRPADLICGIGPSVCRDCYEISEDVAEEFRREFPGHVEELLMENEGIGSFRKYQLDLWAANRIVLEEAGVPGENIHVTDICTCCNPDLLFSHRVHNQARGNNTGFLMLNY